MNKIKKSAAAGAVLAGIIPVVIFIAATAASGMMPGQKYCFLYGDGLQQFTIFPKAFFRRLFSGESLVYSFENGMGMPTVAINAFYSLSPFNILFLLIPNVETAGFVIVCSKLFCAAVSVYVLLLKVMGCDPGEAVFLSMAYALCSFFSSFYISLELLDMLYILPMIIVLIVRLLKTGKWVGLCLLYAYSFIIHFYCAYITGVFSAVIFFSCAMCLFGKDAVSRKRVIWRYFICVLIAIGLSLPLTLPAMMELFSLRAADVTVLKDFSLSPWEFWMGFFPGVSDTVYNTIPMMYAGLPVLILSVLFFTDPGISGREKLTACIPLLFLTACSFIEPLYLFMHAFDAPNGYAFRFSWMISLCLLLAAARELREMREQRSSRIKLWLTGAAWAAMYFAGYLLYVFSDDKGERPISAGRGAVITAFIIIYILLFSSIKKTGRMIVCAGLLLAFELFMNELWYQAHVQDEILERTAYEISVEQAERSMAFIEDNEKKDTDEFYRVRYLNSITDNISMLYGFNGLGWFCSVENENVRRMLKALGYAAANLVVNDYGSTPLTQMLFSQKYDIECGFAGGSHAREFFCRKNENVLPLGYMADDGIKGFSLSGADPFEAQNSLVSAICGNEHRVYKMFEGGYAVELDGLELFPQEGGIRLIRTKENGSAAYVLGPDDHDIIYAYMARWGLGGNYPDPPALFSNADMGGMGRISSVTMPHVIPMAKEEDGYHRLYLLLSSEQGEILDYEALYFAYEDTDEIRAVYDDLAPGGMEVKSFSDDMIEAEVEVSPDRKLLFTTIPYNESWQLYVDGQRKDTVPLLDGALLGAELTEGKHELLFIYRNIWVITGWIGGGISASVLLLLIFMRSRAVLKNRRVKRKHF